MTLIIPINRAGFGAALATAYATIDLDLQNISRLLGAASLGGGKHAARGAAL